MKSSKVNQTKSPVLKGPDKENIVPVVGIGSSAGGLDAIEKFLSGISVSSGIEFVLIQHLSSGEKSLLEDLLKQYTEMKIFVIGNGIEIKPNCVYLTPPDKNIGIMHGKLHLIESTFTISKLTDVV